MVISVSGQTPKENGVEKKSYICFQHKVRNFSCTHWSPPTYAATKRFFNLSTTRSLPALVQKAQPMAVIP
jgi:hypothetical protein